MKKLLQINVTANWGSTGKIAEQIGLCAMAHGWDSYIVYGRMMNPSKNKLIKVGSQLEVYEHYVESNLLDSEGLASRRTTKRLLKTLAELQPDIVHLHNIHDHWLNFKMLFEYLNQTEIKVVWTFHDFWAITGHCSHFVQLECDKFTTECNNCPITKDKPLPLIKQCNRNFRLKESLFSANRHLTIVPVSEWVEANVRKSFLQDKEIRVIPNGVDTEIFKPMVTENFVSEELREVALKIKNKFVMTAVSSQWKSRAKGMFYYKAMAQILKHDEVLVLVGVSKDLSKDFPKNMIGISRTNNQHELAALYTRSDVICSFSEAETFGLTIVEGFACGTPAVVFDNTAPPLLITPETGYVVSNKNIKAAYQAIQKIRNKGKKAYSDACVKLVHTKYEKELCYNKYIELYDESLLK